MVIERVEPSDLFVRIGYAVGFRHRLTVGAHGRALLGQPAPRRRAPPAPRRAADGDPGVRATPRPPTSWRRGPPGWPRRSSTRTVTPSPRSASSHQAPGWATRTRWAARWCGQRGDQRRWAAGLITRLTTSVAAGRSAWAVPNTVMAIRMPMALPPRMGRIQASSAAVRLGRAGAEPSRDLRRDLHDRPAPRRSHRRGRRRRRRAPSSWRRVSGPRMPARPRPGPAAPCRDHPAVKPSSSSRSAKGSSSSPSARMSESRISAVDAGIRTPVHGRLVVAGPCPAVLVLGPRALWIVRLDRSPAGRWCR